MTTTQDPHHYRGWTIDFEYGYYIAIGPNYEPGGEPDEDGRPTGHPLDERVEARTREDLLLEIDAFIEEANLREKRC